MSETPSGFVQFVRMPIEILNSPRAGLLKAAASFLLPCDFEPSQVERFFPGGPLFAESFLVGLDRGGLGLEFLVPLGGGVLFLLCGVEFLLTPLLGLLESLQLGGLRLVLPGGVLQFSVLVAGFIFEASHPIGGGLALRSGGGEVALGRDE